MFSKIHQILLHITITNIIYVLYLALYNYYTSYQWRYRSWGCRGCSHIP